MKEVKLLGPYNTEDLKWNKNTSEIGKKAYRAASFTANKNDLRSIYLTYVIIILDKPAVVWHTNLTAKNRRDLERVQKYSTYENGLEELNLDNLNKRREIISLNFAKNYLKNDKVMKRKQRKFKTR